MPDAQDLPVGLNTIIFVLFVVTCVGFVIYNIADTNVKFDKTFESMEIKHAAHLLAECLKGENDYIDFQTTELRSCARKFDIDKVVLTDTMTEETREPSLNMNIVGNDVYKIAVLVMNSNEIHPGWLYVEA